MRPRPDGVFECRVAWVGHEPSWEVPGGENGTQRTAAFEDFLRERGLAAAGPPPYAKADPPQAGNAFFVAADCVVRLAAGQAHQQHVTRVLIVTET